MVILPTIALVESKTPVLETRRVVPSAAKILTKESELLCLYVYILILLQNVAPVANLKALSATVQPLSPSDLVVIQFCVMIVLSVSRNAQPAR